MKKLLALLTFAFLLSGCSQTESTDTIVAPTLTPVTFEQQLQLEGIEFTYVDPNEDLYAFESTDASYDIQTGASGNALYASEDVAPAIRTAEDLVNRKSKMYMIYQWEATEDATATTLAEAAVLENAEYVSELFPNDGSAYAIVEYKNSLGTVNFITVSEDGTPNAAIFGGSFVNGEGENAEKVYASATMMAYTETFANIVNGSDLLITYYEYDPTSILKMGVGTRNAGARVETIVDEDLSVVAGAKDADGNPQSLTLAEYIALSDADKEAFQASYLSLKAEVSEVLSIG